MCLFILLDSSVPIVADSQQSLYNESCLQWNQGSKDDGREWLVLRSMAVSSTFKNEVLFFFQLLQQGVLERDVCCIFWSFSPCIYAHQTPVSGAFSNSYKNWNNSCLERKGDTCDCRFLPAGINVCAFLSLPITLPCCVSTALFHCVYEHLAYFLFLAKCFNS